MIVSVDKLRADLGDYTTPPQEFSAKVMDAWTRAIPGHRQAVIMVGAPGSGKSTWLAKNAREDVVYLDATNTWPASRARAKRIAESLGARVSFVVVNTPLAECLRRNASRPPSLRVPEDQITRQWQEVASATISGATVV